MKINSKQHITRRGVIKKNPGRYMIALPNYERPPNFNPRTDDQIIEYNGKYFRVSFGRVKIVSKKSGTYTTMYGTLLRIKYNENQVVPATKENIRKQIFFNLNYATKSYYGEALKDAKKYGIEGELIEKKKEEYLYFTKTDRDYLRGKMWAERRKLTPEQRKKWDKEHPGY